jgi:hypothetical protein
VTDFESLARTGTVSGTRYFCAILARNIRKPQHFLKIPLVMSAKMLKMRANHLAGDECTKT